MELGRKNVLLSLNPAHRNQNDHLILIEKHASRGNDFSAWTHDLH